MWTERNIPAQHRAKVDEFKIAVEKGWDIAALSKRIVSVVKDGTGRDLVRFEIEDGITSELKTTKDFAPAQSAREVEETMHREWGETASQNLVTQGANTPA